MSNDLNDINAFWEENNAFDDDMSEIDIFNDEEDGAFDLDMRQEGEEEDSI